MAKMIVSNLAYDLIFTIGLSLTMLRRQSLRKMSSGLVLPLILAVLSILMADNLDTIRTGKTLDTVEMVSDNNGIK